MRKLLLSLSLVLGLGACANLQNEWAKIAVLSSAQVTVTTVVVAGNTFDALEATATAYLRLPKCTASNGPICRDTNATKAIVSAVRSGRVARNNLKQFFIDHPGQLGPQGLYDALQTAIGTLQSVIATYNIGA
jgi:hypothetical protein